jgi:rhodanese-related sulfurtransferase
MRPLRFIATLSLACFVLVCFVSTASLAQKQKKVVPEKGPRRGPISRTTACEKSNSIQQYKVDDILAETLVVRRVGVIGFPGKVVCLKNLDRFDIVNISDGRKIATAVVSQLLRSTFRHLDADMKAGEVKMAWAGDFIRAFTKMFYPGADNPDDPVVAAFIELQDIDTDYYFNRSRITPPHPLARSIGWRELWEGLLDPKVSVVDIRSPDRYRLWHLPRAINNPFVMDDTQANFDFTQLLKNIGKVRRDQLPRDKSEKVIVYGQHILDRNALIYIYGLRYFGYTNIEWYREGKIGWHGNAVVETPESVSGIPVVSDRELLQHLKDKKKILIDVRPKRTRRSWIPTSKSVEYSSTYTFESTESVKDDVYYKYKRGDVFYTDKIPGDKAKDQYIVYGIDRADWSALNAIRWMKSLGFKNVSWYRQGFLQWESLARWRGRGRYPIEYREDQKVKEGSRSTGP